jgi:hypothetical protein
LTCGHKVDRSKFIPYRYPALEQGSSPDLKFKNTGMIRILFIEQVVLRKETSHDDSVSSTIVP